MTYPAGIFVDESGYAHVPVAQSGTTTSPSAGTWRKGDIAQATGGGLYICTAAGTPGTWAAVGGGGTAAGTTFTPAAGIAATDVQAAIQEVVTDVAATYPTRTGGGGDAVFALASLTGTIGIDLANGNMHYGTLAGNTTFTFTGATNAKECEFVLSITQDSTPRTITWPASVKWAGGVAPTLSSGSGAIDQFVFRSRDGGTTWYGATIGKAFA